MFEMVLSNDIQPMRLFLNENIISHVRAVIFVNDGINRLDQITDNMFEDEVRNLAEEMD